MTMTRLTVLLSVALLASQCFGAVAKDASMTAGNGGNSATYAQFSAATSASSTGMTVGASATCLLVLVAFDPPVTSPSATWNSTSMTLAASSSNGANVEAAVFVLVSPASGNKTIALSWTTSSQGYYTAISFTGTDTSTCIKSTDSVHTTSSSANASVAITSDANGATVAQEIDDDGIATTNTNGTAIESSSTNLTPNAADSFILGGTSNTHTFNNGAGNVAFAGVHVIAPSGGTKTCTLTLMGAGPC